MSCGICDSLLLSEAMPIDPSLPHEVWHGLYLDEIRIALRNWSLIRLIEVALRNKISLQLESRFGDDFFLGQPKQLMSGEQYRLREAQRASKIPSRSVVVRNLPMGFWLQLLSKKYESTLWAPALHHSFPGWAGQPRNSVHEEFTAIWTLRNRIAHHEAIGHMASLPDTEKLVRTLLLLNPEFEPFIKALHLVESPHEQ